MIGVERPSGPADQQREQLARQKLDLGREEVLRRVRRALGLSSPSTDLAARLSVGRRKTAECRLTVDGGSAGEFVTWFRTISRQNDERALLSACPDHFAFAVDEHGRQDVVETTGGSPLPSRFVVDYGDGSSLTSFRDPLFPWEIAGVAAGTSGTVVGGVRHQFRDRPGGFEANLQVEFPRLVPPHLIRRHSWHLACEFSNWTSAAHRG